MPENKELQGKADIELSDKEKVEAITQFDNLIIAYKDEVLFNIPLKFLSRYDATKKNFDEAWAIHAAKDFDHFIEEFGEVFMTSMLSEESRQKLKNVLN